MPIALPTGNQFRFSWKPKRFNFYRNLTLELEMGTPKRAVCSSCSKPIRLCLCSRFKSPLFNNSIPVTILQHTHEKNHPLNSARIASLGLKNLTLSTVSDVHLEAKFFIKLLDSNDLNATISGTNLSNTHLEIFENKDTHHPVIGEEEPEPDISATIQRCGYTCSLMRIKSIKNGQENPDFDKLLASQVGQDAVTNGFIVRKMQKKQLHGNFDDEESEEYNIMVPPGSALLFPAKKSINLDDVDFEVKHLIVLDGTWSKAKRMYHENPWLKLLPHLKLDIKKLSLYSEVRNQPKVGCLSTIESIVCAMKALGDDGEELDNLLDVFESMVIDQRRCKDERINKLS